jgi:DNA modification methylase
VRELAPYYQDAAVTIYHGRCEEIVPLLDLSRVAMVLADPPYGLGIQSRDGAASVGSRRLKRGIGDYKPSAFPSVITGDDAPYVLPVELSCLLDHAAVCLWGANHYSDSLPCSPGWLVWDKREKGGDNNFADAELAWTNYAGVVRVFRHYWNGMLRDSERGPRLHPMQKPVALMKWCLALAKLPEGALVLDPYTGSGPVLRAAKDMGLRAIGIDSLAWCCERAAERCRQEALFGA